MNLNNPFTNIPDSFQKEFFGTILDACKKQQNTQIVGLKGFGKSLSLRFLESGQEMIKKNAGINDNIFVYLCNFELLSDGSTTSTLKYIFGKMLGIEKMQGVDTTDIYFEVQKYFTNLKESNKRILMIFDSFGKLASFHNKDVFDFLHALYKQNSDNLSFSFADNKEILTTSAQEDFGDFGRLIIGPVIYIKPLNKDDSEWFLNSTIKMIPELKIIAKQKQLILESFGGYIAIIKRLVEELSMGADLKEVIKNPQRFPSLSYNFEMMLEGLSEHTETIKKIILGSDLSKDEASLSVLQKYSLIDSNNKFVSLVLDNYLKFKLGNMPKNFEDKIGDLKFSVNLTASEYKILSFLYKNRETICTRDSIIETVWGGNALDISDHALDQIISRLRKKLITSGASVNIETLRGRGHRLG